MSFTFVTVGLLQVLDEGIVGLGPRHWFVDWGSSAYVASIDPVMKSPRSGNDEHIVGLLSEGDSEADAVTAGVGPMGPSIVPYSYKVDFLPCTVTSELEAAGHGVSG